MPNANRLLLWLLGIVLLGGALWYANWFVTHFEQSSREVRTDVSPEARKNRFLAAELFLRQSAQAVQSHAGRDILALGPSGDDTIVLGGHSRLYLQRSHDALLQWVQAGGHLVLVADEGANEESEPFALWQQLGVELRLVEEELPSAVSCEDETAQCDEIAEPNDTTRPESGQSAVNKDAAEQPDEERFVTVTFHSNHPGEFEARFLADRYLDDTQGLAQVVVGEPDRPKLLRYPLGGGNVTVLSDMGLFTNDAIGQVDHAYLLHELVVTPGKVWLLYSADMPSLLALVWQRAPYMMVIVVVLLLMALWRMLRSSGPQLSPRYEPRRNLLEHLDASAEYSWRIDRARQLFADNRHAVEQAWRRRHPELNSMDRNEYCEWIGEKTGIAARAVERTLFGDIKSEQDFIRATAVMQRLATRVHQHRGTAARWDALRSGPGPTAKGTAARENRS